VTSFPQFLKARGNRQGVLGFVRERRRWPYLWERHGEDERRARLGRLLALVVGPRVRRLLWLDREHAEEKA
jgi:hypothetical protein